MNITLKKQSSCCRSWLSRWVFCGDRYRDTANQVALAVATQLRDIGIDAQIRVWEWGVASAFIQMGDAMYLQTGVTLLKILMTSNPKLRTGDRGNYSFTATLRVDELLNAFH